jgi:hypothetical protein
MPCTGTTRGLLKRARITAGRLVPVGKETDRRWEQGEDPSIIDSDIYVHEKRTKLVVAAVSERNRLAAIGLRRLMRECKLSQAPISKAIKGEPIYTPSNPHDHPASGSQDYSLSNGTTEIEFVPPSE